MKVIKILCLLVGMSLCIGLSVTILTTPFLLGPVYFWSYLLVFPLIFLSFKLNVRALAEV